MRFKHVSLDIDAPVAIIRLDHQEVMNAVSVDMLQGLGEALDAIDERRADVRCIVLTGAGRAFCTGANLQGRSNQRARYVAMPAQRSRRPFIRFSVACGFALPAGYGGEQSGRRRGHELRADGRHHPGGAFGVLPAGVPPHRPGAGLRLRPGCLPRLVGKARAIELSLLGERLPAETAMSWGLINRVHDDAVLMDEALKLAQDLANGPTVALSLIRKLYWDSPEHSFERRRIDARTPVSATGRRREDFKEGVTAFLEKRPAKFTGRQEWIEAIAMRSCRAHRLQTLFALPLWWAFFENAVGPSI